MRKLERHFDGAAHADCETGGFEFLRGCGHDPLWNKFVSAGWLDALADEVEKLSDRQEGR